MDMDSEIRNLIFRKELLNANLETRSLSAVKVDEIEFPPGQKAPYHSHPCPVFGVIISGTCLFQVEDEQEKVLKPGNVFYEPADKPIIHFDNFSQTEPMKFIAFYLIDKEKELIYILPKK
jgi:quercetin dioxygenase-like cupin family protein